jgi:hypothetical protein
LGTPRSLLQRALEREEGGLDLIRGGLQADGGRAVEEERHAMLFGRGAALQYALKELREKGEPNLFDQP